MAGCGDPDDKGSRDRSDTEVNPIESTKGPDAGDSSENGEASGPGSTGSSADCGRTELSVTRVPPTVWLLLDSSGTMRAAMDASSGGLSRWGALREALLDDSEGLVARLQDSISFGLFAYDGGMSPPGWLVGDKQPPGCPRVASVEPALNNLASIDTMYPAQPMGSSTPTHYALLTLQERIQTAALEEHTYVVLATDGKPNLCDFHDGLPESDATVSQALKTVSELEQSGIKTFAISMAGDDDDLRQHLDDVAAAGGTGEPAFTPSNREELVAALSKILGSTATCDVKLQAPLTAGTECKGEVQLKGQVLACNGRDGFRLKEDLQTLELLGGACERLKTDPGAKVTVSFPCGIVVL